MDPTKSPMYSNSLTKRSLTREFTANFRDRALKSITLTPKSPKRLPRSNSNACLSRKQQIENFMPRHLLLKNLETSKPSDTPLSKAQQEKIEPKSASNARYKCENEVLDPNALFRSRILKPQMLRKQNDNNPFVSSLSRNQHRESPTLSPTTPQNAHFQKEGFETLYSFFKRSSSKSPARIFPDLKRMELQDPPKTPQRSNNTPVNTYIPERPASIVQRLKTETDTESTDEQGNWAYVAQVISDLSTATGVIYSWEEMDAELTKIMTKKKAEYWNEVISEHDPDLVEILVVDMTELMVKRHTEMDTICGDSIADKIDQHMKEESPYQNEALHLIVYFHKKGNKEKKLVLSKYCFYFAKNAHFKEDLKSEKDVIIFYFLILGLCTYKMVLEHEPVRKIKINSIKERAMSILKGEEIPLKPVQEWITPRFDNHSIVDKTFFNLNNISKLSSTYLFNIRSYIKSRYSKLSFLSNEDSKAKNEPVLTFKRPNTTQTQRSVVPYIQQLAFPATNSSSTRAFSQTISIPNTGDPPGDGTNIGRKTPVLKKRTKIVPNSRERLSIKLEDPQPRLELKKSTTVPSFFDTLSPKGNTTATFFYKPESKYEIMTEQSEDLPARPEILNIKLKRNAKRNSSATPTLKRSRTLTGNKTPQGYGNLALSPWLESSELPVFDPSPLLQKPHNLVLKSLAEELINEDEEHPSTLRLYLEEKGSKGGKMCKEVVLGSLVKTDNRL